MYVVVLNRPMHEQFPCIDLDSENSDKVPPIFRTSNILNKLRKENQITEETYTLLFQHEMEQSLQKNSQAWLDFLTENKESTVYLTGAKFKRDLLAKMLYNINKESLFATHVRGTSYV